MLVMGCSRDRRSNVDLSREMRHVPQLADSSQVNAMGTSFSLRLELSLALSLRFTSYSYPSYFTVALML